MNHHYPINSNHIDESAPGPLDRLLAVHFASGEELAPSSGFALSVMETVQAETSAPPPIAFPWKRALPGAIAVLCTMAGFIVLLLRRWSGTFVTGGTSAVPSGTSSHPAFLLSPLEQACCWIAAAVLLSLAAASGSMRLARGK